MNNQIFDLYEFTFNNPNNLKQKIEIGKIQNELALKIQQIINLDINNFVITIDNYAILHTINKHGKYDEYKRGQIPVKKEDFEKILEIINQFDNVKLDKNNILIFDKYIESHYFIAMEVRLITSKTKNKQNSLAFVTMYIRKQKP